MARQSEQQWLAKLPEAFSTLVGIDPSDLKVLPNRSGSEVDASMEAVGKTFWFELKVSPSLPAIEAGAQRLLRLAQSSRRRIVPVFVSPYLTESGRAKCEELGVNWMDLSGNGRILGPGLRVLVSGHPNRFPKRGRPSSAFAPKSARISRLLLLEPAKRWRQKDIAAQTGLSAGLVSRVLKRLVDSELVQRTADGHVELRSSRHLLEAFAEDYEFDKHEVIRGHVAARSGAELSKRVSDVFREHGVEHAATGLSAAWQYTHFVTFRTASFFVETGLSSSLLSELGFNEREKGANLWLIYPNDSGVFMGAADQEGIRCVHPIQAYLDLRFQPERATDAAVRLSTDLLEND